MGEVACGGCSFAMCVALHIMLAHFCANYLAHRLQIGCQNVQGQLRARRKAIVCQIVRTKVGQLISKTTRLDARYAQDVAAGLQPYQSYHGGDLANDRTWVHSNDFYHD